MAMSQMGYSLSPQTKYIMRHQDYSQLCRPINLFQDIPKHQIALQQIKQYLVVGDAEFKKKYCEQKKMQTSSFLQTTYNGSRSINQRNKLLSTLEQTNLNTIYQERNKTLGNNSIAVKDQGSFIGDPQKKALFRFHVHKQKQGKFESILRKRLSQRAHTTVDSTMTYSNKNIQVQPNPEYIDLVNSNVPQFWEHSLRENHKRLKQHVRGNKYGRLKTDEMLQTFNGRRQLIGSIPKIKQDFINGLKQRNNSTKNSLMLGGRKIQNLNESLPCWRTRTEAETAPKLYCEQVLKIQYSNQYRVSRRQNTRLKA